MITDTYKVSISTEDIGGGLSPREVQDAILAAFVAKLGLSATYDAASDGDGDLAVTVERIRGQS